MIAFVLLFAACQKDDTLKLAVTDPTVTDIKWFQAYSGTVVSGKIEFQATIPDGMEIPSLKLYKVPTTLLYNIDNPKSIKYSQVVMFGSYPTSNDYFYFVFTKKDGTLITLQPFQAN